eukprot:TRINITY_DN4831_c1_g1_i1.p1 TRINITY_DN4831_c1_g1~~TRINITY_DN4831_c1_g1_i1.p1  ORF type:complete len:727 (+),score=76.54 TRINITY_DN4831_c1_g1_i1:66-2246(+)
MQLNVKRKKVFGGTADHVSENGSVQRRRGLVKIQVVVRVRPLAGNKEGILKTTEKNRVSVIIGTRREPRTFAFDSVLSGGDDITNRAVLNHIITPSLNNATKGLHTSLLAVGSDNIKRSRLTAFDLAHKSLSEIFGKTQARHVEISCCQIDHDNSIKCLFAPEKGFLKIREHPAAGPYVDDLTSYVAKDYPGSRRLLDTVERSRDQRSHVILTLSVNVGGKTARILIADILQRDAVPRKTAASLASLSRVAHLQSQSSQHTPYRETALTWLLKDGLCGNSKTIVLSSVSQIPADLDDTLAVLKFSEQACGMYTSPTASVMNGKQGVVTDLKKEIKTLEDRLKKSTDRELVETLNQNQRLMKRLTSTWDEKWRETVNELQIKEREASRLEEEKEDLKTQLMQTRAELLRTREMRTMDHEKLENLIGTVQATRDTKSIKEELRRIKTGYGATSQPSATLPRRSPTPAPNIGNKRLPPGSRPTKDNSTFAMPISDTESTGSLGSELMFRKIPPSSQRTAPESLSKSYEKARGTAVGFGASSTYKKYDFSKPPQRVQPTSKPAPVVRDDNSVKASLTRGQQLFQELTSQYGNGPSMGRKVILQPSRKEKQKPVKIEIDASSSGSGFATSPRRAAPASRRTPSPIHPRHTEEILEWEDDSYNREWQEQTVNNTNEAILISEANRRRIDVQYRLNQTPSSSDAAATPKRISFNLKPSVIEYPSVELLPEHAC